MKLSGDEKGIEALKELHARDKDYLKFLIQEARSNVDLSASFTAADGTKYVLKVDPATGLLEVQPA